MDTATTTKPDVATIPSVLEALGRATRRGRALLEETAGDLPRLIESAHVFVQQAVPGFELKQLWREVTRAERTLAELEEAVAAAEAVRHEYEARLSEAERRVVQGAPPDSLTALQQTEATERVVTETGAALDPLVDALVTAGRLVPVLKASVRRFVVAALTVDREHKLARWQAQGLLEQVDRTLRAMREQAGEHDDVIHRWGIGGEIPTFTFASAWPRDVLPYPTLVPPKKHGE